MSTYYGLQCKDHNERSGTGFKSGQSTLRSLAKLAPQIKALLDSDTEGIIELSFDSSLYWDNCCYGPWDVFAWLKIHAACSLEIYNEYGGTETL